MFMITDIFLALIKFHKSLAILLQEVMNGLTSTNADQFSVNKTGCKACTVSIPLKYMHTPSEIIQIDDVENTGRLIAAYIRSVSNV